MELPLDLKTICERYGYAAKLDPRGGRLRSVAAKAWNSHLAGCCGAIRPHSRDLLEATCDRAELFPALVAIRDAIVLERSDDEMRVAFPPEALPKVARTLRIRTRDQIREARRKVELAAD